jgi:acyl-coenzyme A thioesterase PaaI-like protein
MSGGGPGVDAAGGAPGVPRVLGSSQCVVCGQDNLQGLRVRFVVDTDGVRAAWTAQAPFQGFRGILHGGIVLALMDDAMWYAAYGRGALTLTAEARVRYRRRVEIGEALTVRASALGGRGRLWRCAAEVLRAADGVTLAAAEGTFVAVRPEEAAALRRGAAVHEYPREVPAEGGLGARRPAAGRAGQ